MSVMMMAQGWPASYGGVMLQGFYWDSYIDTQWSNLESQADELSDYFDLIWIPQSGNCNSSYNVMGYTPVYWFDQNSSFGTEAQLLSLINTYKQKNVGIIADVVINHRGSLGVNSSWVDFPAETHNGVTYQLGLSDICADDDGGATAKKYTITGANDTGTDWSGMRDLDHTSTNVQSNVTAYLNFLKDDLGYAGFRYDMTKGYAAQYTALYNAAVNPTFSVGEYWDGNLSLVENWINGTKVNGIVQSAAFDFPTRYSIRDACKGSSWNKLSTKGLAGYDAYKRYAVTFVENHDTQYRSSSYAGDPVTSFIEAANAYILSMPGTPCIFLPHWESYKNAIKQLITARKLSGITNESAVSELSSATSLYAAEVSGTHGKLIIACGTGTFTPASGYTQVLTGKGYKVYVNGDVESPWISMPSGTYEKKFDVTLTALSDDADVTLVYTTDGTDPTASSSAAVSGSVITITESSTLRVGLLSQGAVKNIVSREYTVKPFVAHTATVYLKNPGWTNTYFYSWANDGSGTQLSGSWPGSAITSTKTINGAEWYYESFDVNSSDYTFNVIFDQGNGGDQTIDIGPVSEDTYYEIASKNASGKYTVTDVTATVTDINELTADSSFADAPCKIYSANGQVVETLHEGEEPKNAIQQLKNGLYIIKGKKFVK